LKAHKFKGQDHSISHRHLKLFELSIRHLVRPGANGFVCEADNVSATYHVAAEALADLGE
jgi:hypothetical protein